MHWNAPSAKDTATDTLEKRLWEAADDFRANSGLKSQEYSAPVLGLIFLRFADVRFSVRRAALEKTADSSRRGSKIDDPNAYHAEGVLYRKVRCASRCSVRASEIASTPNPKSPPHTRPTATAPHAWRDSLVIQ